jgi:hypothetical protein
MTCLKKKLATRAMSASDSRESRGLRAEWVPELAVELDKALARSGRRAALAGRPDRLRGVERVELAV